MASARPYPIINKRAYIYMTPKGSLDGPAEVGQFEDWGFSEDLNTLRYRECGYNTPLLVPMDHTLRGYVSKGKLNHELVKMMFETAADGETIEVGNDNSFWIPKIGDIKLILLFSPDSRTGEVRNKQVVYNLRNCVFFNHSVSNAGGIVSESLGFEGETLEITLEDFDPDDPPTP